MEPADRTQYLTTHTPATCALYGLGELNAQGGVGRERGSEADMTTHIVLLMGLYVKNFLS